MQRRGLIFLVLAIFFSLGTILIARSWLSKEHAQFAHHATVETPKVAILVAAQDLPTGSFVRPEDLRWQVWPKGQIAANYLRKGGASRQSLTGSVARQRIAAGEPITANLVIKPGDHGFLAAVLTPGMRAVSVAVSAVSGVSGLVFPGDHVDLILENEVKRGRELNAAAHVASETVLSNLRILAIDQSTDDDKQKPSLAKTVTFEVTPKQAEIIEVARSLGNLYLSLRGLADDHNNAKDPPPDVHAVSYVWDSQVTPLILPPRPPAPTITVLRGEVGGVPSAGATAPKGAP